MDIQMLHGQRLKRRSPVPQGLLRARLQKLSCHDTPDTAPLPFKRRKMSMTMKDSIEMEQPEWLTKIETVLEVLNEGVLIADDRHRILFANSRFLEMTGFSRHELIGSDASSFYSSQEWSFLPPQIDIPLQPAPPPLSFIFPLNHLR